ncbi:MAG: hypothetical protein IID38_06225 [Planctomycetes bacterium]|nr:hypothetical protein [Planctomycetota bacterium]
MVLLAEKLNIEGLVLQKSKTRILTASEFSGTWKLLDPNTGTGTDEEKLLNISLRFDPYSDDPERDYEALSAAVKEVNVVGILAREIAKTAIDTTVMKQAINAIRAIDVEARTAALLSLLDKSNLDVLSPVFVTLMRTVRSVYDDLADEDKDTIDAALVGIFDHGKYILSVELNLAYYLQAIARRHSERKIEILIKVYETRPSPILRRIIIATMAHWECDYWLSDIKHQYSSLDEWEKRAFILASYCLTDEGKHWRKYTKKSWTPMESLASDWMSERWQTQGNYPT